MSEMYVYISILLMAFVTYLIRFIPLLIFRKPIKNRFIKSFLYYSPYITLAVMTFPAVLTCTQNLTVSIIGFVAAVIMAFSGVHFVITTFGTCFIVFVAQLLIH